MTSFSLHTSKKIPIDLYLDNFFSNKENELERNFNRTIDKRL